MTVMLEPQQFPTTATPVAPVRRDQPEMGTVDGFDVSVCIVSWNVKDLLRDCLNSLKAQAGNVRYETIVVDNASSDGSAEMVQREFHWVTLVDPKDNLGFGRANNLAYRHSTGRWVLLLNPD